MTRLFKIVALGFALAAAPALAAGAFGSGSGGTPPDIAARINHPVHAALLKTLAAASKSGLGLAPDANTPLYLKPINGPRVVKGNKVGILYVGADFCPYCAGQRWALMLTLLRFGTFSKVRYMASSAHDAFASTPTFTFQNAEYKSKYVTFQAVETSDRNEKKLQSMNKAQSKIFNTYDAPPYMPYYGGFPFVYVGGQYVVTRPLVSPSWLSGMNWNQIAEALNTPASQLYQAGMPQVNAFTAAICVLDGGNPDDVCSAPGVTAANAVLYRMNSKSGH